MTILDTTTTSRGLLHEVEQFLFHEAELLDERRFPEWLDLFTEDCQYWIPAGDELLDGSRKVSIVNDDKRLLTERVWRFEGGLAYAQQPASVTSHLVGNVHIRRQTEESDDGDGELTVISRFVVTEFREELLTTHAGRAQHRLVRDPERGFRIRRKLVELVNRNGHLGNLGLPL
jgi:3-phenylpropionate/cinnamic acid dioxygenase small subunit